jgi:phosphomethylpyrimidine synthase
MHCSTLNKKTNEQRRKISRTPFPNSTKIYVSGEIHPISSHARNAKMTRKCPMVVSKNPPITIYDTSGPFTDPNIIDIRKGLPRIREQWILDRNDVEELSEISSEYGKERLNDVKLNDLRFEYLHKPMRAKRS